MYLFLNYNTVEPNPRVLTKKKLPLQFRGGFPFNDLGLLSRSNPVLFFCLAPDKRSSSSASVHCPYAECNICLISLQAVHKALLKVHENGTEAAAATAIIIRKVHQPSVTIKFNRPFIMLIVDKASAITLFMGKIVNPIEN